MTKDLKYKVLRSYCLLFYIFLVYKWWNGMLLCQMQPVFFYVREDLTSWLFMQTGLHQWLLGNRGGWLLFDGLFYTMPLVLYLAYVKQPAFAKGVAIAMLIVNWVYVQCYTLYPTNSIEGHLAWLFFPLVFIPGNPKTFELLFKGLRYFFLFFMASAGVWKIAQGGIFNTGQMSNILLFQHKELLLSSPGHWYAQAVYWLAAHPAVSYGFYAGATVLELLFIAGFFTLRFDRWLLTAFVIFLLFDHLLMRITYYDVLPMAITLLFFKKPPPERGSERSRHQ